jgi:hypothetical protein
MAWINDKEEQLHRNEEIKEFKRRYGIYPCEQEPYTPPHGPQTLEYVIGMQVNKYTLLFCEHVMKKPWGMRYADWVREFDKQFYPVVIKCP